MDELILHLRSWPRAIIHVDGDAFFTSCEEAIHPELRGKALVTGGERGSSPARATRPGNWESNGGSP